MKRLRHAGLGLALALATMAASVAVAPPAEASAGQRLTVGVYFPWWGTPTGPTGYWSHWYSADGTLQIKDHPPFLYDSGDRSVLARQLSAAASSGLDALAVSWWGRGSLEDQHFSTMLDTAASVASPVHLAAQFETAGLAAGGATGIASQLSYVLSTYSSRSGYLHYLGRPVIFIYNPAAFSTDYSQWSNIIHSAGVAAYNAFFIVDSFDYDAAVVFDGIYQYEPFGPGIPFDPAALRSKYLAAGSLARQLGKLFAPSVEPGFDDSAVRPQTMYVPRNGTSTYDQTWKIALSTGPNWVVVATWNEWHEATEIEWSQEYGYTFMNDTATWSAFFKSMPTPAT